MGKKKQRTMKQDRKMGEGACQEMLLVTMASSYDTHFVEGGKCAAVFDVKGHGLNFWNADKHTHAGTLRMEPG